MIRRQEKFSAPLAEQEPQRLLVSRTVMRLAGLPELGRMALHGGGEILLGFRLEEIPHAAGHMGGLARDGDDRLAGAAGRSAWVTPRIVDQWTIRWGTPRRGTRAPGSKITRSGTLASRVAIHWLWLSANFWARPTSVRSGIESTTSPVAFETRSVIRLAVGRRLRATLKDWPP